VPGLVFCAGQTATGEIEQATVRRHIMTLMRLIFHQQTYSNFFSLQTKCLQNLKEVLELADSSLDKIVKYNVFLADMKDFAAMNEAYIAFLPKPMPSRSCLQALPPGDGTVIEIECIAQA
jgi:enamine deaminase RidA (YjgF/YER057c/UK114 family)